MAPLNIMADLRDRVAVIEAVASVNRFDPETAMRLFTGLERIIDDIEVLLEHGLAHTPTLIAAGGPLVQRENGRGRRLTVVGGVAA